ncbi:DUF6907 domain-containing protein [Streptomyces griseoluteus]|uniref:DUF6907 domain-containing protein n=1 Tax=Streptomyces griseoluteus TaxID=29306 RepID=UPI0037FC18C8
MIRTITLDTIDHGPVTFEEPPWCIGHHWQRDIGRNDITHRSVRVKAAVDTESHGLLPVLNGWVSWAPFAELVPRVAVEVDVQGDFEAEDITQVVQGLQLAGARLEKLAAEAIRLRGELS